MARRFHTLDVFAGAKLAGNPLAVVHDCGGLDAAAMQAISREFNLSETVFVLPPEDPVNTARIRIFTPGAELPFAGHPTVGAAVLLATLRAPELLQKHGVVIALEEEIGVVRCEVRQPSGKAARAVFDLPRLPEPGPLPRDAGRIAQALGLSSGDIVASTHRPMDFSAGVPFAMVPLASLDALGRARPGAADAFAAAFGGEGSRLCCYLYVRTGPNAWRARMFAPGVGLAEDPATGSAAAAFAGALMAFETPGDGQHQHVVAQGVEMGRPSEIVLTLDVAGGKLISASIGGEAVIISEGLLHL